MRFEFHMQPGLKLDIKGREKRGLHDNKPITIAGLLLSPF
jgi:hypothetical protein